MVYESSPLLVRSYTFRFGLCRLLITVTCNPKWKELKLFLQKFPKGTLPNDIPNITVRLFYAKFKCILDDIVKNNIFEHAMAYYLKE